MLDVMLQHNLDASGGNMCVCCPSKDNMECTRFASSIF